MRNRFRLTLALLLVAPLLSLASTTVHMAEASRGLLIVATLPSLAEDVKLIAAPGDRVVALIPPGVDPHTYQLKPRDVALLGEADVVVSSGHTRFEKEVKRLVEEHRIRALLVEVPSVVGIKLYKMPGTSIIDYHMPIYYPDNYIAFMKRLVEVLEKLNPDKRKYYEANLLKITKLVEDLKTLVQLSEKPCVGDKPYTLYVCKWISRGRILVLEKAPGAPITPSTLAEAAKLLSLGGLAVVSWPPSSPSSRTLLDYAKRMHSIIVRVYPPSTSKPILESIEEAALELAELKTTTSRMRVKTMKPQLVVRPEWFIAIAAASLAAGALSPLIAARRLYFLSGSLPHTALLAATLAIPLSASLGAPVEASAVIIALAAIYCYEALEATGVDPDVATSVFLAATASGAVLSAYYVLTRYNVQTTLWAYILGDPLLATWSDALTALLVAAAVAVIVIATYRKQLLIAVSRETAKLAGVRVEAYDIILLTTLTVTAVVMLRILGFVLEHILLLLPGIIAANLTEKASKTITISIASTITAGVIGLTTSIAINQAPAGTIGAILLALYTATLAYTKKTRRE